MSPSKSRNSPVQLSIETQTQILSNSNTLQHNKIKPSQEGKKRRTERPKRIQIESSKIKRNQPTTVVRAFNLRYKSIAIVYKNRHKA